MEHVRPTSEGYNPPPIQSDFYGIVDILTVQEKALVERVRAFATDVATPTAGPWPQGGFARLVPSKLAALNIVGLGCQADGCAEGSDLLNGIIIMSLARSDPSMGAIDACGSQEQKQRWLPAMARLETIGSFGLTEPDEGLTSSRRLKTTCRRDGDDWVLNGQKKWLWDAAPADIHVIWARDEATGAVKGFVVEQTNPGLKAECIERKTSPRTVHNAVITLTDCRVAETERLQLADSFSDTARVLRKARAGVAWLAVGTQISAYEHALCFAQTSHQFERPIGGFQLAQELLVRMLGNVTSSQALMLQLAHLQEHGQDQEEHSALAKAVCTLRMHETVGWARDLMSGNGVLFDDHVGRHVADAEAIHAYEGAREINTLVVGKAITGLSAFF